MKLDILDDAITQAVAMAQNANTWTEKQQTVAILRDAIYKLEVAIEEIKERF